MGFLRWLKKLFKKKQKRKEECLSRTLMKECGCYPSTPPPSDVEPYYTHRTSEILQVEHVKWKDQIMKNEKTLEHLQEEHIRKEFLPEPQTHRRTTFKSYVAPAEQHRDSISKFMKGKASNRYLKTIKQSPKIKIEEED